MRLVPTALVVLSTSIWPGCIIYEEKFTSTGCEGCIPNTTDDPDPNGTQITDDLLLSISDGLPGESVLSTLISTDSRIDITSVVSVSFDRDITVVDSLHQTYDVVLLLDIGSAAPPGLVEVFVDMDDGARWVLARPFEILSTTTPPTGDTATISTGTGDTGTTGTTTGTGDTGTTTNTGDTGTGTGDTGAETGGDTGTADTGTGLIQTDGSASTGDTGITRERTPATPRVHFARPNRCSERWARLRGRDTGAPGTRAGGHGKGARYRGSVPSVRDLVQGRCRSLLHNDADAQEAMQEVFLRVWRYRDSFRGEASPATWLFKVTTTTCLNRLRTRRRRPEDPVEEIPAAVAGTTDTLLDNVELRQLLDTILVDADERTVQCLVYHYVDGMTHDEVGALLGVTGAAVRKRLSQFRARMGAQRQHLLSGEEP